MDKEPKVTVLCGSSRFCDLHAVVAWELEKAGQITMSLHLLPSWYENVTSDHQAEHEGVADQLDELHLRKIDLADRVLVVDPFGYFGDSTKNEIVYAEQQGVPVRFLSELGSGDLYELRERYEELAEPVYQTP